MAHPSAQTRRSGRPDVPRLTAAHPPAQALRRRADRGLRCVRLASADDHKDLRAAARRVFNATHQRCRICWMRNALAHAPAEQRFAVTAMLKTIFAQETKADAEAQGEIAADAQLHRAAGHDPDGWGPDDMRRADRALRVEGPEAFVLQGRASMAAISRDPADLVAQTIGRHHQYPDGLMPVGGTLFVPTEDRKAPGAGFTHRLGDVVTVTAPGLGTLRNCVALSTRVPEWTFGIRALMANQAGRGLPSPPFRLCRSFDAAALRPGS